MCTACGAENQVRVFPAILHPPDVPARAESAVEGEGACFDHPSKRAMTACRQCGRFVCGICAAEFAGEIWCPTWIAAGERPRSKNGNVARYSIPSFSHRRGGPGAIVLGIATWKRPLSMVRRTRWRTVRGMAAALAEIGGWQRA